MAHCDNLHLVGTPGTNKVMASELIRLAQRGLHVRPPVPRKQGQGALVYPFDPALAWLAVHYHRTATRVLWELYYSDADRLEPLYDQLLADVASDARPWCRDGARISVRARNVAAFAAGERQIVGTVKNALLDGAQARGIHLQVDPRAPDIHIDVRMHDQRLSVAIDVAGASLSQRGYRTRRGEAPLREHLAAVLLMLARYNPRHTLLFDPMCGAGTICIEAALMASASPLWVAPRQPACIDMPRFDDLSAAQRIGAEALFADTRPVVIGNDIDARSIAAAKANARTAGVTTNWLRGDFRALTRSYLERTNGWAQAVADARAQNPDVANAPPGLILCNPPYGHRLDQRRLEALYRDLGDWCGQFAGCQAGFLVAHEAFEGAFGHRPRVRKPLNNGSLRGYFYLYEL